MTPNDILLLVPAVSIAVVLAYFQYFYKMKNKSKVYLLLACLRFFSFFLLFLLLLNPKIIKKSYDIIKTPLPIVFDNSRSIKELKQDVISQKLYGKLMSNKTLQQKFDVTFYQFDDDLYSYDTLIFQGSQTNIDHVAKKLKDIYKNKVYPTLLITDGNATVGNDYVYSFDENNVVYPIILGDTTTYFDLKINAINVNKYAFYKNKFPVEVFVQYTGDKNVVVSSFSITQGNTVVYKEDITFSKTRKSALVNLLLSADRVGLQRYKATITSADTEKNTYNNTKNFAVEIIDQKSQIALVSVISHPDIGALKRAIQANAQRKVTVVKPSDLKSLQEYDLIIFYQPTIEFKALFEQNKQANLNTWIITGLSTDFNFLNQQQDHFTFQFNNQKEDYAPKFNSQFNLFTIENINFEGYPPLQNPFGTIKNNKNGTSLLLSRVNNIDTDISLLTCFENQGMRNVYVLGENIWKWRIQNFLDKNNFDGFDLFIDKVIQFLLTNNSKKSLVINYESFYNSNETIGISAQYFNKNYEFDENAQLSITLTNEHNKQIIKYDLLKGNKSYNVNLDGLDAGTYTFVMKETNSNTTYNGHFEVLDFDIEKQFVNPNIIQLTQLAQQTSGKLYYADQTDELIDKLVMDKRYHTIQKATLKKVSLINNNLLLVFLLVLLAVEWFIRKYNGLL